jgi:hypothetical protein
MISCLENQGRYVKKAKSKKVQKRKACKRHPPPSHIAFDPWHHRQVQAVPLSVSR